MKRILVCLEGWRQLAQWIRPLIQKKPLPSKNTIAPVCTLLLFLQWVIFCQNQSLCSGHLSVKVMIQLRIVVRTKVLKNKTMKLTENNILRKVRNKSPK